MSNKPLTVVAIIISVIAIVLSGFSSYQILDYSQRERNIQDAIDEVDKRISAVEASYSDLSSQLTMISESNVELVTTLNQTINTNIVALENKLSDQSESLARNLTDTKESLQTIILDTQSNLKEIVSAVETLNSKLDDIFITIENFNSTIGVLSLSVSKLEEKGGDLLLQSPKDVYEATFKSVVIIRTDLGQGSGFMYSSSNLIVTNWHVVDGATDIEVEFYDRTRKKATIVGTDAYSDVAVVMVPNAPVDAKPLQLGNSSNLYIGQQVVAIGNPLGLTGSLSSGFVSQINRQIDLEGVPFIVPVLQLDLTIAPGSSGGPLLDLSGNVVGITNAGTSVGFNFAVPSNIVERVATSLIEKGYYSHPLFGFNAIDLNPEVITTLNVINVEPFQRGLLIMEVIPEMPAANAGLRPAILTEAPDGSLGYVAVDIILAIDDQSIIEFGDWWKYVAENVSPGQSVTLTLWRSGAIVSLDITPVSRPQYQD